MERIALYRRSLDKIAAAIIVLRTTTGVTSRAAHGLGSECSCSSSE
jgi:hypothetical protein